MAQGEQPQGVQLSEIRANVEGVQEKMQNNVAMIVDRGEQLNNLDDKSQELQGSVNTFQRQAKALELQTRIQRCKLKTNLANKIFGHCEMLEIVFTTTIKSFKMLIDSTFYHFL